MTLTEVSKLGRANRKHNPELNSAWQTRATSSDATRRSFGRHSLTCHDVPGITSDILRQLTIEDPWGWSAVTVAVGGRTIVIYNAKKTPGRQASDIAHELAHVVLDHDPATIILSESVDVSMRSFDQKQEDEANCLAWALLLPRDALFAARIRRMEVSHIADRFGVTESLVQFRLRTTGIDLQLRRSRRG
jgi:hypothetical protein